MLLTLEEVKAQCRIDQHYHEEDNYLYDLIEAAEENVAQRIRYNNIEEAFPDGSLPPSVRQAIKIVAANLYENRESIAPVQLHNVPDSFFDSLIGPYVRYSEQGGGKEG
ncbi:phage gp6-like head-tail connector protein [Parabacteroides distasonis]|nr:phage gp6-like head-tail connector protein [Parabacteroides distasonis]